VEHNYISPSSTVGMQLHVSPVYMLAIFRLWFNLESSYTRWVGCSLRVNNRCGYQSITQQYLKICLIKDDSKLHVSAYCGHDDDGHNRPKHVVYYHPLLNTFFRYCCVIDWYPHLLFIYTQRGWLILEFFEGIRGWVGGTRSRCFNRGYHDVGLLWVNYNCFCT